MHPIDELEGEHRAIETVLQGLETCVAELEEGRGSPERLRQFAEFFLIWVDGIHHSKELLVLRSLRAANDESAERQIKRLLADHEHSADTAAMLLAEADALLLLDESPERVAALTRRYIAEQRKHMGYENRSLYPLARATLVPEQVKALTSRFVILDRMGVSPVRAARDL